METELFLELNEHQFDEYFTAKPMEKFTTRDKELFQESFGPSYNLSGDGYVIKRSQNPPISVKKNNDHYYLIKIKSKHKKYF